MKARYAGDTTGNGPSGFWADCPIWDIDDDAGVGYGFFDDFTQGGLITSPTSSAALVGLPYSGFGSSGSTITYTDVVGGGITLAETTDNEGVSIFSLSHCFNITQDGGALWFECRVTPSHTATTEQGMFVGLADSTAKTATMPLTATASALADLNLVGLHKLDTDLTSIKTVYKADTVTAVTRETVTSALEATTAVKLGFKFDPEDSAKLSYYVDGTKQATTKTIPDATGTDFPADVRMAPIIAILLGAAASDNTLKIDWWGCYQKRV